MKFATSVLVTLALALAIVAYGSETEKVEIAVCKPKPEKTLFEAHFPALAYIIPAALGIGTEAIGFTSNGIAAGSLAAYIQKAIGSGFPFFSLLQSLGQRRQLGPNGELSKAGVVLAAAGYWLMERNEMEDGTKMEEKCIKSDIVPEMPIMTSENSLDHETNTEEEMASAINWNETCFQNEFSAEMCSGHGTCEFQKEDNTFFCQCQDTHYGTHCEIEMKNDLDSAEPATISPIITATPTDTEKNEDQDQVEVEKIDKPWISKEHIAMAILIMALGSASASFAWYLRQRKKPELTGSTPSTASTDKKDS